MSYELDSCDKLKNEVALLKVENEKLKKMEMFNVEEFAKLAKITKERTQEENEKTIEILKIKVEAQKIAIKGWESKLRDIRPENERIKSLSLQIKNLKRSRSDFERSTRKELLEQLVYIDINLKCEIKKYKRRYRCEKVKNLFLEAKLEQCQKEGKKGKCLNTVQDTELCKKIYNAECAKIHACKILEREELNEKRSRDKKQMNGLNETSQNFITGDVLDYLQDEYYQSTIALENLKFKEKNKKIECENKKLKLENKKLKLENKKLKTGNTRN